MSENFQHRSVQRQHQDECFSLESQSAISQPSVHTGSSNQTHFPRHKGPASLNYRPSPCQSMSCVSLQNCLIRVTPRGREALVTDFGLAREVVEPPVKDPGRKLSLVGSAFWMAPEMLRGEPYDRKVDVFSFGILLCEIFARIPADPEVLPRTQDYGLDVEAFSRMVPDCPQRLLQVAASCCMVESFRRPAFTEIQDQLDEAGEGLEPPSEPELTAS
ncbi:PREDICTED: dual specificity testis-specific protein kinase 2-like [Cyprinodon variegatus]|uniref:dual specificity testis-specific protein kinase 2-like n=1 Tax=Cyprinodon variegatus TaxID=28743 RepID=UPI0007428423|nr:PREDICTED: dual specificity testis-specific protein kinase 2-like [Cyprinodon variegatus]